MKRSKQLIGINIVDVSSGKILGKIKDIIFTPGQKKILGFCVNRCKWIKNNFILSRDDIKNIGKDVVTVRTINQAANIDDSADYIRVLKEKNNIYGLKVITCSGEEIGYIEDVIIEENSCTIEGYVLTDGIFEDILMGKRILPFTDDMIFGDEAIIVSDKLKDVVLKNDISLKKAFKETGDN